MKLNVYVGMRKTLNKNKKKIILEMKKNKQTKTQEFKSLFEWELDLKKFEYTMVPFYKSYNPYTAKCIEALW